MILLRLDVLRLAGATRHPRVGAAFAMAIPLGLLCGALWVAGRATRPGAPPGSTGVAVGLLIGGALGFAAYGILFGGADAPFLRRLGVSARVLFRERALRLLALAFGAAVLATLPFASAGAPLGRVAAVSISAALAGWGAALIGYASAARGMSRHRTGARWGLASLGMWDRDLAAAAPLVYAPVPPLLAAGAVGGWAAAVNGWIPPVATAAASLLAAVAAEAAYASALPRFAPQVHEMAFAPPPGGTGELVVGRGLARVLPHGAAAVWARDSVVAGRRFAWAARVVWPVAIVCCFALARWGRLPAARHAVVVAAVAVLLLQASAAIGLGRVERAGPRWIDRSAGIGSAARLLGRWAWAWGLSLWLAVPLALAWGWWAAGPGWPWLVAGGITGAVGAGASVALAEGR
ncbi:MAG TPA: hypothetical protein VFL93_13230 [Longimicrobiaceae bacterium]|nr:hypothetical protein [Longimicrobiaceae bacterium]